MVNGYVERDVTRFNAFSKSFEIFQNSGNHKPRVSIANLGFRNEPQDFSDYGFLRYVYIYIYVENRKIPWFRTTTLLAHSWLKTWGFQRQLVRPNKRHGNPLRLQTEAPSWLFQVPKASAFGSLDWVKRTS